LYILTPFFKLDRRVDGKLLPMARIQAIQEELAGFLLDEVIPVSGDCYQDKKLLGDL
jgi:hypothetical protein